MPGADSDDGSPRLLLRGVKGWLRGEERRLSVGEQLVVGRSRRADLSVRNARRFMDRADNPELLSSEPFLTVSRRHALIRFLHPDLVEIEDLSQNGTFVDGRRIDKIGLTDLRTRTHVVAIGATERLVLSLERPATD